MDIIIIIIINYLLTLLLQLNFTRWR